MDDDLLQPARGRTTVRLTDPGELAAGLPNLIGFRPQESLVLVTLAGVTGGRVGMTVRVDLPPPEHAGVVAAALADAVSREEAAAALVAVVSEAADEPSAFGAQAVDLPHRGLLRQVVLALGARGTAVRESLLVRRGRWWSYECPHACCAPNAGTPLPAGPGQLEVASVVAGQVVAIDRSALAARIARPEVGAAAMAAVCLRAGEEHAAAVAASGADEVAVQAWAAVLTAVEQLRPRSAPRLPDAVVARVVWGLCDVAVRDRALVLATGPDADVAEALWAECTRRAPAPLDAAPATLLAVHAWLRGDGAMAGIALDRALASEPGYALAELLAEGLKVCLPPAELRRWIEAAADGALPA
jgi:Domain of unknown function (DUF4192)